MLFISTQGETSEDAESLGESGSMRRSLEVEHILAESADMATHADHPLTTGHVLLGMLTSPNRGAQLLGDLRADADRIVEAMRLVKGRRRELTEPESVQERIDERMEDAARHTDATLVSSLHLLLALTREQASVAYRVFVQMGIPPREVRTMALSRIHGPMPRAVAEAQRHARDRAFQHEPSRPVALVEPPPPAPPDPEPQIAPAAEARPAPQTSVAPPPDNPFAQVGPTSPPPTAAPITPAAEPLGGAPYELDPERFPLLTSLGRNLTAEAAAGRLEPVFGRASLIDAMIDILNKRRSNNPCLVGEPGVGKTAVVEGLALALYERGASVRGLGERVVISLDVGSLVAGTELRGAFSRRMARLKDEVRQAGGQVIVFIDELHTLVGAGSGDGALDAANDLKAALARGEFPCVGATTPKEYHRHIERDPALERRFQALEVPEPDEAEAVAILRGVSPHYEAHHGVVYLADALEAAVRLSLRYLVDRRLPDKAINLIDTAAARAVRHGKESVEPADVAEVVAELAQIPIERLLKSDAERILGIRDHLREHIVGHGHVLDTVSRVIQRNSAGFASRRPIGSFLFLGPTGVGKTETARVLADFLFDTGKALTQFDMSEYMEKHAVSRLLGAAPGYVGHEEAGALTASLARRPYQIILFDEIEKAHPDVLNILLQIMEEGHVTDAKARKLSFRNTVIVMTSNLGADALDPARHRRIGFGDVEDAEDPTWSEADLDRVRQAARKALLPELWGRIDEKCVFAPLTRTDVAAIARLLVEKSSRQLEAESGIAYEVDDAVIGYLIDHGGYEPAYGARPMQRAVERICETTVAQAILKGEATAGDDLEIVVVDGELLVRRIDE